MIAPLFAENKKLAPNVATLQQEITRLQAELDSCKKERGKESTSQRTEAIASLRAVQSALNAGANFQEFKKYYIESKIKIDVLPNLPENNLIREISDIYKDAVSFGIIRSTGIISDSELKTARLKYDGDKNINKILNDMKVTDSSHGRDHDLNQLVGDTISKMLIIYADDKFKNLK
jgi:small-conductance mechanosensitive channel